MTRKITLLVASALALGTFGLAPLAAQAAWTSNTGSAEVSTSINEVFQVSFSPVVLPAFDPANATSKDFSLAVTSNFDGGVGSGAGYTVSFATANVGGSTYNMVSAADSSTLMPYTIKSDTLEDSAAPDAYTPGNHGATLKDAAPGFTVKVATSATDYTKPSGAYSDTLTATVTPAG
jgi:hypothetical protein